MKPIQLEVPGVEQAFNLAGETTADGSRLVQEALDRAIAKAAAEEYALRMQRTFAQCPGFIGGDAPDGEQKRGSVTVEPSKAAEARVWLKRRFRVNQDLKLSSADGLVFEVITRRKPRKSGGQTSPPLKIAWAKPVQFELPLAV